MAVRKSFMRSLEVVIAIMLFLGFYSVATTNVFPESSKVGPEASSQSLLESLDNSGILSKAISTYSLAELENYFSYLLAANVGYKLEIAYFEPVSVKNDLNAAAARNVTFIRALPKAANLGSLGVYDKDGNYLPTMVTANYYEVAITVQVNTTLNNDTITLQNVRFSTNTSERINETSFEAYAGRERVNLSLSAFNYDNNYYNATSTVTLLIPSANPGELLDVRLFYAANESYKVNIYPSLAAGLIMDYSSLLPQRSKMCQITASVSLNPNEEKILALSYELNTDTSKNYDSLAANSSSVSITAITDYYEGSVPQSAFQPQNAYNVMKTVLAGSKNALVNLKVWYYE